MKWLMAIGLAAGAIAFINPALATATEPGGANQVRGVEGKVNQTLFNGTIRLKVMTVRNAESSDNLGDPHDGNRWVVIEARCSNGEPNGVYIGNLAIVLVNSAGDSAAGSDPNNKPAPQGPIQPGAGWNQRFAVEVPADFTTARMLITDPSTPGFKAFRIDL
ncbi:MAG: hypothetical protein ABI231_08655 [Candidatus Tumulicola sp.]